MANTMRKNTDIKYRGGAARSSGESPVMGEERRGSIIQLMKLSQPSLTREEPYGINKIV